MDVLPEAVQIRPDGLCSLGDQEPDERCRPAVVNRALAENVAQSGGERSLVTRLPFGQEDDPPRLARGKTEACRRPADAAGRAGHLSRTHPSRRQLHLPVLSAVLSPSRNAKFPSIWRGFQWAM